MVRAHGVWCVHMACGACTWRVMRVCVDDVHGTGLVMHSMNLRQLVIGICASTLGISVM